MKQLVPNYDAFKVYHVPSRGFLGNLNIGPTGDSPAQAQGLCRVPVDSTGKRFKVEVELQGFRVWGLAFGALRARIFKQNRTWEYRARSCWVDAAILRDG